MAIVSRDIAVISSVSVKRDVYSGMSVAKLAVMVPGPVIVAVVSLDCGFVMVIPVVVLHDEKR
jgi:hypothetical protein